MEIKTLGIVGAGQMGAGIAQVAAANGLSVVMNDIQDEFVEKGFSAIRKSLERMVKKEKISQEDLEAIARTKKAFEDFMEQQGMLGNGAILRCSQSVDGVSVELTGCRATGHTLTALPGATATPEH